jgi:hypothetical protein
LYASYEDKNQIVKSICECLGGNDRLKLARFLSDTFKNADTDFFVRVSLVQKLKTAGAILAISIPILISIIQFLFYRQ